MKANRKTRREQDGQAVKNHTQELEDRQQHPRPKVRRRPTSLPKIPSFLYTQYDRLSGIIIEASVCVCVARAAILDSVVTAFALVTSNEVG